MLRGRGGLGEAPGKEGYPRKITRLGSFALGFGLALAASDGVRWLATPPEAEAITVTTPEEVFLSSCWGPQPGALVITDYQPLLQPVHNCSGEQGQQLQVYPH